MVLVQCVGGVYVCGVRCSECEQASLSLPVLHAQMHACMHTHTHTHMHTHTHTRTHTPPITCHWKIRNALCALTVKGLYWVSTFTFLVVYSPTGSPPTSTVILNIPVSSLARTGMTAIACVAHSTQSCVLENSCLNYYTFQ